MDILARCKKLGIEIPTARQPGGTFSPVVKVGELVFTSGQTAKIEGKLLYIGTVSYTHLSLPLMTKLSLYVTAASVQWLLQ